MANGEELRLPADPVVVTWNHKHTNESSCINCSARTPVIGQAPRISEYPYYVSH